MSPFDADTALEPVGEGCWRGAVPPTWSIGTGPNGGFMAALAARAVQLASGWPPRSLTLHYLLPPAEAPIDVAVTSVRQGRSTAFLRLDLLQEDRPVVTAMAVCGAWYDSAPSWSDAVAPELPAPEDCDRIDPDLGGAPPILGRYDMRIAPVREEAARPARVAGWIRTAQPRAADNVAFAAMTDAFVPPAFFRAGEPVSVPTLELTIHFRGLAPPGEHPWIAAAFATRVAAGGVCEEDGELWSADGRLLAQSRQLALVRRRT